jgi:hypothetical protein
MFTTSLLTNSHRFIISFFVSAILFLVMFPNSAIAQNSIQIYDDEMQAEIIPRVSPEEADAAISSVDDKVDLLLFEDKIILQFSDLKLDLIAGEIREEKEYSDSHFVNILLSMVSSGVRTLLDRGLAIPLYEISEMSYSNNRLVILNMEGKEIFRDVKIDDKPLMEQFSRSDARQFIGEVERRMI